MGSLGAEPDYDVLILGAGLSGCYAVYRMRELRLKAKVLEAGSDGTRYLSKLSSSYTLRIRKLEGPGIGIDSKENYHSMLAIILTRISPGARFDSESYTYGFSWSEEVLKEWNWTEHFAPQPETRRYISFVCDKFGLREDIQFNTRIKSAEYIEKTRSWKLTDLQGNVYTSRFLITAIGVLCNPTLPNVPGVEDFKGEAYHTARWPEAPVSFEGKSVGIIGTGATAIQAIPEIAKTAGHLTVFQRTPNWAIPLHNAKISTEEMQKIREGYPEIFKRCAETRMSFVHDSNPASIWDASEQDREELWEHLYAQPGFGMWVSNYKEILVDHDANKLVSDFVAKKIRQRVHNQDTAETLIPKNHGFGTRRVPMETFYYEAYNRANVSLVDLLKTPIERITETGVATTAENFDFDILIYATGFDAITGSFDAIEFRGSTGVKLLDKWADGPRTYLGFTVQHFPNMFMVMGPHQAYGNIPRSIEYAVDWISNCIQYMQENNLSRIEPTGEEVQKWTEHVHETAEGLLSNEIDSWMTGVNKNVAGKQKRIVARYSGSAPEFKRRAREVADAHYDTFLLA